MFLMKEYFFLQSEFSKKTTSSLGLHNLLKVSTSNSDRYFLTRKCCYVFHCLNLRTNFNYPDIPNKVRTKYFLSLFYLFLTPCPLMRIYLKGMVATAELSPPFLVPALNHNTLKLSPTNLISSTFIHSSDLFL